MVNVCHISLTNKESVGESRHNSTTVLNDTLRLITKRDPHIRLWDKQYCLRLQGKLYQGL